VLRSVQVVAQAVADAHLKLPGQGELVVAGIQVPLPLHLPAGVRVEPLQVAPPHDVVWTCNRQPPAPSQVPSWPQALLVSVAHSLSGSVATLTALHSPLVLPVFALTQAMHRAGQLFSQHTPSTHEPEEHSRPALHVAPFVFFAAHAVPAQ